MEEEETVALEEIEFHGYIRTQVVCLLLFLALYGISFAIIQYFKTRSESDELYSSEEDWVVYRVSVWMCSCSLAVSIGAVALLPFSVIGYEVLHAYPNNFYLKWLNWSLISSLWNYVFLLSNVSLFFLLPFAYFFIESQGFSFHQQPKPFVARVYETCAVCTLVIVILVSLANVFYSLFMSSHTLSILFAVVDMSNLSIPLVYSLVSLVGVFLLLLSVPVGLAKMFDLTSQLLIAAAPGTPCTVSTSSSTSAADTAASTTAAAAAAKVADASAACRRRRRAHSLERPSRTDVGVVARDDMAPLLKSVLHARPSGDCAFAADAPALALTRASFVAVAPALPHLRASHRWARRVYRVLRYPVAILVLLLLTGITVAMVTINTLQLLFGFRALPAYVKYVEVQSRHTFGITGALVENTIIGYIVLCALVGVYSLPLLQRMRPVKGHTSMTCVIANCAAILLLSSAFPVLARTLGITSFDLLGEYGRLKWISNFTLIWSYNILFAGASTFSLLNTFTLPVRAELRKRVYALFEHR